MLPTRYVPTESMQYLCTLQVPTSRLGPHVLNLLHFICRQLDIMWKNPQSKDTMFEPCSSHFDRFYFPRVSSPRFGFCVLNLLMPPNRPRRPGKPKSSCNPSLMRPQRQGQRAFSSKGWSSLINFLVNLPSMENHGRALLRVVVGSSVNFPWWVQDHGDFEKSGKSPGMVQKGWGRVLKNTTTK